MLDHPDRGGRVGLTAQSRDTACDDSAPYVERGAEGQTSAPRCDAVAAGIRPPRLGFTAIAATSRLGSEAKT
ncbi:hypothetical protein [Cypionkella sp.]|uniref:hypothetical protein n=1 Tax=Cypionkella sp. TaxID=2811411 RepID=UPI002724E8DB|nr:hypothetical protein [Cypionkella sp.]MDO8984058.1 hypothetical protein [Cypionkella sp.]MDP2047732.1 hypothetical protein [Cypionkella sp.]